MDDFILVCGCDGVIYSNDCECQMVGVSKVSDGVCEFLGWICGGVVGIGCGVGEICVF